MATIPLGRAGVLVQVLVAVVHERAQGLVSEERCAVDSSTYFCLSLSSDPALIHCLDTVADTVAVRRLKLTHATLRKLVQ